MGIINSFKQWIAPEFKAAAGSGLYHMPAPPALQNTVQSLEQYARKSDLVYACVEKKAAASADPQLVIQERTSDDDWENVTDHELLAVLQRPNPVDTWETFIKSWTASENLTDTFYCEIVPSRRGKPAELYPLNPARVEEEWVPYKSGARLRLVRYSPGLGGSIEFRPEDLLIRRRHGFASIYGNVSPLEAALGSVDSDIALNEYVRAFFNNGGVPSGMLSFKDRKLSDEEATAIQQRWMSRYGRSGRNRKGVAVMDMNAAYTPIGSQLSDLDSEVIRGQTETRICSVFGVPPILIGAYTALKFVNQRASVGEAQEDFWKNTMRPELTSIRNFLTWTLLPMFADLEKIKAGEIRVGWDFSEVQALQESEDDVNKRARENVAGGIITVNEARSLIGFDEIEGGDVLQPPRGAQITLMPGEEPKKIQPAPLKLLEKKTLEIDGVPVSREPRDSESHLDLKTLRDDYETAKERIAKLLIALRAAMAEEAAAVLSENPGTLDFPALGPSTSIERQLNAEIKKAVERGHEEILAELGIPAPVEIEETSDIRRLASTVIGGFLAAVTARIINEIVRWRLLDIDEQTIAAQLPQEITGQSEKWIAADAGAAANTAIQTGRRDEIEANPERWDILEYSALLDLNTCGPCERSDGLQATRIEDLPPTPNPECEGGPRCRCFIVTITV